MKDSTAADGDYASARSTDRATIIDLHQDLLPHIEARDVYGERWQTSWEQLRDSAIRLVVASTWPGYAVTDVLSRQAMETIERYMTAYQAAAEGGPFFLVKNAADVDGAQTGEETGILIHVEGVPHSDGPIEDLLARWWDLGCRSVGLVWNKANGLAFGPDQPSKGLTEQGRAAMRWLDSHAMVPDLAHMSAASFWDAMEHTDGPLLVSHANARALCDHPRNLDDAQVRAVAERGGVVGVVLSSRFLDDRSGAGVARVVDHIEHLVEVGGIECVGVGSDFGGVLRDALPDMDKVEKLPCLFAECAERGFPPDALAAIAELNAARALKACLTLPELG